jgi:branched-chain amino acid transport system substrate-binding protein
LKKTVIILAALLIVAILAMAGCPSSEPEGEKTLQIGALMSLTGWFVVNDGPGWDAIKIGAELVNDYGGITINGQKYNIEVVVEDCKSTMDGVTAAANRLIYDKGVEFIVGPSAFYTSAATPVTEPAKVLIVPTWNCNTPGELDANTPYTFAVDGTIPSNLAAIKFMKQAYPQVKNVVIIHPDDGAVPFVAPIVKDLLAAEGFTVIGDTILYPNEMVDFSPIVTRINAVDGIDAIFQINGVNPHVAAIAKGLRGEGNDLPYITGLPTSMSEIVAMAGVGPTEDVSTVCVTFQDPNDPPLIKEMGERERAAFGEDYVCRVAGSNSLFILKEVIEATQSFDPTAVKDKWESLDEVETLYGTGIVCGDQTFGIVHHFVSHPLSIDRVVDGENIPGGWIDVGVIP